MDTLTVPSVNDDLILSGNEYISGDGTEYNPANPEFGNTYTLTDYSGIASTFDATYGDLITESDRHNNTLSFDPDGVFSNTGRAVTFVRDGQGRITQIIDPNNNKIIYGYSPSGDLVSVQDRDNNIAAFAYSASQPHFLNQMTDGLGHVVLTERYDTSGRMVSLVDAKGASASLSYNPSTLSESLLEPGNSQVSSTVFNSQGLITKSIDADGHEVDYTYNGLFVASQTQVIGGTTLTTTFTYNAYGQVTTKTDPSGAVTYATYDVHRTLLSISNDAGTTSYNYDQTTGELLSATDAPVPTARRATTPLETCSQPRPPRNGHGYV